MDDRSGGLPADGAALQDGRMTTFKRAVWRNGAGLLALCLAGCATTQAIRAVPPAHGDASWHAVDAADTKHYQLAMGEVASGATIAQRVAPVYPPDLLGMCPPPQDVQAKLIVDTAGHVGEVRVDNEAQATTDRHRFIEAVRGAARQWTFQPLQVNHWAADADGNSHVVDSATRPFSLDYVFHFACHAGQAEVSTRSG
jgi:hypothetical protein